LSWRPDDWCLVDEAAGIPAPSPWMRMFENARRWVG
jgi:tRNA(Met) C34 N-acetyltransferase TmcA